MTAITATVRTHRRSLAVLGAIVAIAFAVLALVLVHDQPGARHAPHRQRLSPPAALLAGVPRRPALRILSPLATESELSIPHWPVRRIW